ncbi:MAG: AEC family transporter [Methanobacteriaceae archaeon]|nr:AEC family transporter [Methanobacteriaceae archaeon]
MDPFFVTLITIIFMIFLGYFLKRIDFLKVTDVNALNKIVMNIALPCMIFKALYKANMNLLPTLSILPVVGLLSSFVIGIIVYFILKYLKYDNKKLWSILLTVIIGNTGFMGYPIILGAYGNSGFVRAIFFDINTTLTFLIMSVVLIIIFGGTYKQAIKKAFLLPPLWALILGICFNLANIPIGEVATNIITSFSALTIPLIMIALGLSLRFEGLKWHKGTVTFTAVVKLVFYPLITLGILILFRLHGLEFNVSLIQAAMPSGMFSLVLAISHDLDFRLTSDCIFTNTLLSLITIPIIVSLL